QIAVRAEGYAVGEAQPATPARNKNIDEGASRTVITQDSCGPTEGGIGSDIKVAIRAEGEVNWPQQPPTSRRDEGVDKAACQSVISQDVIPKRVTDIEVTVRSKGHRHWKEITQAAAARRDERVEKHTRCAIVTKNPVASDIGGACNVQIASSKSQC